jgi:cupin 2 domain-containing protein
MTTIRIARNLLCALPEERQEEVTQLLAQGRDVRIERIVSFGQSSPEDFWYDQKEAEWVAVLTGRAGLEFEGEGTPVVLGPGDSLLIPARARHRVAWTAEDEPTVWLAVFFAPS